MKELVIVGSSGFAREIGWAVERINAVENKWKLLGYIDKDIASDGVVGDDTFLMEHERELDVVVAIGSTEIRNKLVKLYKKNPRLNFPNVIDPGVLISPTVNMGMGNILCAGSIVTCDVDIGDFNIINLNCTIGHAAKLGNCITINPGANISGNVSLNDFVTVGTGVQILQNLRIEPGIQIGAGAVVSKNLDVKGIYVGVPAKRME